MFTNLNIAVIIVINFIPLMLDKVLEEPELPRKEELTLNRTLFFHILLLLLDMLQELIILFKECLLCYCYC